MSLSDRYDRPAAESLLRDSTPTRLHELVGVWSPPDAVRRRPRSGVHALLVGLLEEAIACLLAGVGTRDSGRRAEARRAEQWIRSPDATSLFAFETVCLALDLEADPLRSEILRQVRGCLTPPARQRRRHEVSRRDRRLECVPAPRKRASTRAKP